MSNDAEALRSFYQSLFGWEPMVWEESPGYAVIPSIGAHYGIAGGIGQIENAEFPPYLTIHVEVTDLDDRVGLIPTLGGVVVVPPMPIEGVGRMALFTDPAGNMVGLLEPSEMMEVSDLAPSLHPVVHFELGTNDAAALRDFYASLLGWTYNIFEEHNYTEIGTSEDGIGGGIAELPAGVPPYVSVYVEVINLQTTLDAATALGATTVLPPMVVDEELSIAMFIDPQGFAVGLVVFYEE